MSGLVNLISWSSHHHHRARMYEAILDQSICKCALVRTVINDEEIDIMRQCLPA